jgi:predicted phosphoribosyltransferase
MRQFENRAQAGRALAALVEPYRAVRPIVLALPRGGVPVAYEIAVALDAPLDVFVVRKLGVPGHEEYAMGAVASGGSILMNEDVIGNLGITQAEVDEVLRRESAEIIRREAAYRGAHAPTTIQDRTVILVDDGMATGASMRVAIHALRMREPKSIVVAVPVAAREALIMARTHADDWACVFTPEPFFAVGAWYLDFEQVTDDEVRALLETAAFTYSA